MDKKQPSDNPKIAEMGKYIRQGAMTFLKKNASSRKFAGVVSRCLFCVFCPNLFGKTVANITIRDHIGVVAAYIFG